MLTQRDYISALANPRWRTQTTAETAAKAEASETQSQSPLHEMQSEAVRRLPGNKAHARPANRPR